jgi:DnaK suppressor protein
VSEIIKNLEEIRTKLLARKHEIEEKLLQLSQEKMTDDQVQDPGDQALSSSMESLRSSLQSSENEEYKRTIRALEKINDGSYGVCIDCGQVISERRLNSYPDAARCLLCQEQFEDK